MKLMLRRRGDVLVPATPFDLEAVRSKWPDGFPLFCDARRRRSVKQNSWLHAIIAAAFANQQGEQFESARHLRAFAFCVAGHKDTVVYKVQGDKLDPLARSHLETFVESLVRQFIGAGEFVFVRQVTDGLAVDVPRSWAFDSELTHEEACRITDAVAAYLVSEEGPCPGITIEQLFEAAESEH